MLEYKIASVKSVESFLEKPLSLQAQQQLAKNATVWETLQILSTENVYNEDYAALLQAFTQYRKLQTV
jgi:osmoprotectant transport system ATP-binding protein